MLWADLDKPPISLDGVEEAVETFECDYEIYTSRSATCELEKCRVLIPLAYGISGADWLICQRILNDELSSFLCLPDRSNEQTGQPCYLPNRGEHYDSRSRREGVSLDMLGEWATVIERYRDIVVTEMAQRAAEKEAKELARASKTVDPSQSLIHAFNQAYEIEELLFEAGYDEKDGKFRHPNSQSGSFSANIKDGITLLNEFIQELIGCFLMGNAAMAKKLCVDRFPQVGPEGAPWHCFQRNRMVPKS
jgi:hypothetical protein